MGLSPSDEEKEGKCAVVTSKWFFGRGRKEAYKASTATHLLSKNPWKWPSITGPAALGFLPPERAGQPPSRGMRQKAAAIPP